MNKHTANFLSTAVVHFFDSENMEVDRDAVEASFHIVADLEGYNNYGIRRRMNTLSNVCPTLFNMAYGIKIQAIGNEENRWYMYDGGIKENVMDFFEDICTFILNGNEEVNIDYKLEWKNQVVEYMNKIIHEPEQLPKQE